MLGSSLHMATNKIRNNIAQGGYVDPFVQITILIF